MARLAGPDVVVVAAAATGGGGREGWAQTLTLTLILT